MVILYTRCLKMTFLETTVTLIGSEDLNETRMEEVVLHTNVVMIYTRCQTPPFTPQVIFTVPSSCTILSVTFHYL